MKRRDFLAAAAVRTAALAGLARSARLLAVGLDPVPARRLRDNFWLWGQNAGSHHVGSPLHGYKLPGVSHMEPREGCAFFGIQKCLRVAMSVGPFPPFDAEAEKLKDLKEVVWSAIGAGSIKQRYDHDRSDLDDVLRIAEKYPNVTGAVLDDFFAGAEVPGRPNARHSLDSIRRMSERLHGFDRRRLDLWMVWYTYQLDFKVADYLGLCDVVKLCTWKGRDLVRMDENIAKFVERTPGKRRYLGIYFWNYGETKPLEDAQMRHQMDVAYTWLKSRKIEGLVFNSNAVADIGLPTVDYARAWIAKVGDEPV